MCRICNGDLPTAKEFYSFQNGVKQVARKYKENGISELNEKDFVNDALQVSSIRFSTGVEWGEPEMGPYVMKYIFKNQNPDAGLLLLLMCSWMDMQERYQTVWSTYLESLSLGNTPKMRFQTLKLPLLQKTYITYKNYHGIAPWFIEKILSCEEKVKDSTHCHEENNVCRIVGYMTEDLWGKENISKDNVGDLHSFSNGSVGYKFLGNYKRLWMALMWLRLDNSIIHCLLERALSKYQGGEKAVEYWYDGKFFNPMGCQIPVDGRVKTNWNILFRKDQNERDIAFHAMNLGEKYNVPPALFDAILFGF